MPKPAYGTDARRELIRKNARHAFRENQNAPSTTTAEAFSGASARRASSAHARPICPYCKTPHGDRGKILLVRKREEDLMRQMRNHLSDGWVVATGERPQKTKFGGDWYVWMSR